MTLNIIIDNTYHDFLKYLKKNDKIFNKNFLKNKEEIIKLLNKFLEKINYTTFEKIIDKENYVLIFEYINKYLYVLMFLFINYNNDISKSSFTNDLIDFSKDINKYFNSEFVGLIMKHYVVISNIKEMKLNPKLSDYEFKDITLEIYNNNKNFDENIIFSIIEHINLNEKKYIYDIIENSNLENNDTQSIYILESVDSHIGYHDVEKLLKSTNLPTNNIDNICKDINNVPISYDNVSVLFDDRVIIPIVDDFMLYHNSNEIYQFNDKIQKIEYIVKKIQGFSDNTSHQEKQVAVNLYEDYKIINKYDNILFNNNKLISLYNDFFEYKKNAYVNFTKHLSDQYIINNNIDVIRKVNFESPNEHIKYRSANNYINICGLALVNKPLHNLKIIDFVNTHNVADFYKEFSNDDVNNCFILFDDSYDNVMINNILNELLNIYQKKLYHSLQNNLSSNYTKTIDKITNFKHFNLTNYDPNFEINVANDIIQNVNVNTNTYSTNDVIKLPIHESTKKDNFQKIKIKQNNNKILLNKNMVYNGICQHNISLNNINTSNTNYQDLVFNFMKYYVTENNTGEFICKSCGEYIDLQNMVSSGKYNTNKQFILDNIPITIALESIPEYQSLILSIKYLDKLIEKIADVIGYTNLVGGSYTQKTTRRTIIKNIIDIIRLNYKLSSNSKANTNNNSNYFVFEFDNMILQYSTKDKDQYKEIKYNNIVAYIIIYIFFEINYYNIDTLYIDKKYLSDRDSFNKSFNDIFGNKKIKNYKLTNYPNFCYLLYIIVSNVIKRKIWKHDYPDKTNIMQKLLPSIIKKIINTIIDIMNNIINHYNDNKDVFVLAIFYNNIITKIEENNNINLISNYDSVIASEKLDKNISNVFNLDGKYIQNQYALQKKSGLLSNVIYNYKQTIPFKSHVVNKYDYTYYICNNKNKLVDEWNFNKCINCDKIMGDKNKNDDIIEEINVKNLRVILKNLCNLDIKYIVDDVICSKLINDIILKEDILEFYKLLYNYKTINETNIMRNINNVEYNDIMQIKHEEKFIKTHQSSPKIFFEKLNTFISFIKNTIKTSKINDINLDDNIYILNHNYHGSSINDIILDNVKIEHINNHSFFNTEVLYFSYNYKNENIRFFYDKKTLNYLGYKLPSDDNYQKTKSSNKLKIKYSLKNMLLNLNNPADIIKLMLYFQFSLFNDLSEMKNVSIDNIIFTISPDAVNPEFFISYFIDYLTTFIEQNISNTKSINFIATFIEKYYYMFNIPINYEFIYYINSNYFMKDITVSTVSELKVKNTEEKNEENLIDVDLDIDEDTFDKNDEGIYDAVHYDE